MQTALWIGSRSDDSQKRSSLRRRLRAIAIKPAGFLLVCFRSVSLER
jgi:hypothetical protein